MAIDEIASTVSLAPKVCVVSEVSVAAREGEVCAEEFVDHLSGEESAARQFDLDGEADDNDSFVDIVSGITAVGDAESEGLDFCGCAGTCEFVGGDIGRACCWHVSLPSSFPISFQFDGIIWWPLIFSIS